MVKGSKKVTVVGRVKSAGRGKKPAKLTAPVKRAIKTIVKGQEETKYIAEQLLINQALDQAIHTPGTDMVSLVPKIAEGDQENQRIGRQVRPVRCRVDIHATFPQTNLGSTTIPTSQLQANEIYVVLFILRSKRRHNWTDFSASTDWQRLLDDGAGSAAPFGLNSAAGYTGFWFANTSLLQYPVNTSEFTVMKRKVVKLVKNQGQMMDGTPTTSPNMPQSCWSGSFTYKLPTLKYDDGTDPVRPTAEPYPTNACVFLAAGYTPANNLSGYYVNPDGSPASALDDALSLTVRNHVWYKDA